jgi:hypothetical protein
MPVCQPFVSIFISFLSVFLSFSLCPSLWHNRLDTPTADQKVWGPIPTRAKAK